MKGACCVTTNQWRYRHSRVSMIITNVMVPTRRQDTCSHHYDVSSSADIKSAQVERYLQSHCDVTNEGTHIWSGKTFISGSVSQTVYELPIQISKQNRIARGWELPILHGIDSLTPSDACIRQ